MMSGRITLESEVVQELLYTVNLEMYLLILRLISSLLWYSPKIR
jgi:hypothetical protein